MFGLDDLRDDLERARFRSMGTEVELLAPRAQRAFRAATAVVRSTFEREDRRFSRFRADSELSRVNGGDGRPTAVSGPFAEAVRAALEGARETAGRFDPTLLDAVMAAGYDRTYDDLLAGARIAARPGRPGSRWCEIELSGRTVRLPAGVHLDLGGIAKGWTVDLAVRRALACGLPWALVNAGGDLRLGGDAPDPLEVGIEDPEAPADEIARLRLERGAVATTSITRRAWGPALHHVVDPVTGAPARGDVLQATVAAMTCAEAEVRAKAALLEGEAYLGTGVAVLVLRDGRVLTNAMEVAA
jgi:thiamine biosynthesis lipoprotein